MLQKMAVLIFVTGLVFSLPTTGFAQGEKKDARVEGWVVRSSADNSTLIVHVRDTETERTVHYDASTVWTSQYHGEKKANTIDASQVKDHDHVICLGTYDEKGEFHARMISKRLSHSQ
jgi:hypothetical protein